MSDASHAPAAGGSKWGVTIAVVIGFFILNGPATDTVKFALVLGAIAFMASNAPKKAAH